MNRVIKIKALSVKQPWANLIVSGEKTVETRVWRTSYRGPILIVSSKSPNVYPAGCAVAVATLVDCRTMNKSDEVAARCSIYPGAVAWVLEGARAIMPLPMRGQLGLFDAELDKCCLSQSNPIVQTNLRF